MKVFKDRFNILIIVMLVICTFLSSFHYINIYYQPRGDFSWWLGTINGMRQNILYWHQFPYRLNYLYSNGVQQPIFYHSTLLYLTVILQLLLYSINTLDKFIENGLAFNITIILINMLTFITMYISSFKIFKNKTISLSCSIIYVLSLYRICNILLGTSLGQFFIFSFVPLFILGIYYLFYDNNNKCYIFVISSSLIFQHHLISTYLYFYVTIIFFIVFVIFNFNKYKLFIFAKSCIFIICINAWLLFPIIYEFLFVDFIKPNYIFDYTNTLLYGLTINKLTNFFEINYYDLSITGFSYFIILIFILILFFYILFNKVLKKISISYLFDENYNFCFILTLFYILLTIISFGNIINYIFRFKIIKLLFGCLQFVTRLNLIIIPFSALIFCYYLYYILNNLRNKININNTIFNLLFILIIFIISLVSILHIFTIKILKLNRDMIFASYNSDYNLKNMDADDTDLRIHDLNSIKIKYNKNNYKLQYFDYEILNNNINIKVDIPVNAYPLYKIFDENNNCLNYQCSNQGRIIINY